MFFVLKELVRYYIKQGSCMYVAFLDASKAFDRVNHAKLFSKLLKAKIYTIYSHTHQLNSLSNCLLYSIIIIYNMILQGRNEILNTQGIEFNSVAILVLWHELPRLCHGQINVAGIRRR